MSVTGSVMVPHPPLIIPEIGRGDESQISATAEAYTNAAEFIASLRPETLVITTPHSVMYADYFHISPGSGARGSFARFGAPQVSFEVRYDSALAERISAEASERGVPAGKSGERDRALDHGTMVPLYFLRKAFVKEGLTTPEAPLPEIVRIGLSGLPLTAHYRLGQAIKAAADALGRRVAVIASGDLSHKLQSYGPYGFAEEGPVYDKRIMEVMGSADFGRLLDFDEEFCEKAAECGHRSFVIMAGTLDGKAVRAEKLSHEDVTGVGYGVCTFLAGSDDKERMFMDRHGSSGDAYTDLARRSLEYYFSHNDIMERPEGLPEEMTTVRAGVFVSLHKYGQLRGCIGTILPTTRCAADEVIQNALSAALHDPRFSAVRADELPFLEISVDVLSEPEEIASEDMLDPKKYGVIVTCGTRRGLLLPDLEGVDTVEDQISISRQKAGIGEDEPVKLARFTVTRHKAM